MDVICIDFHCDLVFFHSIYCLSIVLKVFYIDCGLFLLSLVTSGIFLYFLQSFLKYLQSFERFRSLSKVFFKIFKLQFLISCLLAWFLINPPD